MFKKITKILKAATVEPFQDITADELIHQKRAESNLLIVKHSLERVYNEQMIEYHKAVLAETEKLATFITSK